MSTNITMSAPTNYTTTTNNIVYCSDTPSVVASAGFTLTSPASPAPSLKRRRQFELDHNSDGDADDEEGSSESDYDSESDSSDLEDEDKENVAPPRKRLCFNLGDSPRLRAAELSSESGRSSRASWTSSAESTSALLTPPDSPRVVFRPLEIMKVDDDSEDDVDVKEYTLFASDIECPPTSSDESGSSVGSVDHGNEHDVHCTDSEVELKATTQHALSFSSTEQEEESAEEEEDGDAEEGYEDRRGMEEGYEGEDEYDNKEYTVLPNCAAVRVKRFPQYAGLNGFAIFARHCVADYASEGGVVVSAKDLSKIMAAQSFGVEEEL